MRISNLVRWATALAMVALAASASGCVGSPDSGADDQDDDDVVQVAPPKENSEAEAHCWYDANYMLVCEDIWPEPLV